MDLMETAERTRPSVPSFADRLIQHHEHIPIPLWTSYSLLTLLYVTLFVAVQSWPGAIDMIPAREILLRTAA